MDFVVKMAFDSFSSSGKRDAATPQNHELASETSWAHPRDGYDVQDTPLSVTLWDEAAPAPLAFRDPPDGPAEN